MSKLVVWNWSMDRYVRAYLRAATLNERNLRIEMRADPHTPMKGIVSRKLMTMFESAPDPLDISQRHIRHGALLAFEQLLATYAGADLKSLLIDTLRIEIGDKTGAKITVPATVVWDRGTFGAFSRTELELTEDFYVEKQLLLTEIQHHAEELEE